MDSEVRLNFYLATSFDTRHHPVNVREALQAIREHHDGRQEVASRPVFEKNHLPHNSKLVEIPSTIPTFRSEEENQSVQAGTQLILFTQGISDCIAVGMFYLKKDDSVKVMSMMHFNASEPTCKPALEDWGFFDRLQVGMYDRARKYAVIASSRHNINGTLYETIVKILMERDVLPDHIISYIGAHTSGINFAISSDFTFGEMVLN